MSDIDLTDLLERITGCINNAEYDDEADTLSDAFAVIEAQAAEIVGLKSRLHMVLDREAETQRRHDAKVDALEAEIEYWKAEARSVRKELKSEQKQTDNAMDNYDAGVRRIEAQAAEIEAYDRSLQLKQTLIEEQAAEIEKLREAITALIAHCHELERCITVDLYRTDYCGESGPLCDARKAIAGKAEQ